MNYRFSFLICLLFLFACKTEKQEQKNDVNSVSEKVEKELPKTETQDKTWQFLGFFTGEKMAENDQQLTYDVLLWKKNEEYLGYLYEMWYVTDSNFGESQSKLAGEKLGNTISLKGNLEGDFVLTIPEFSSEKFLLNLDFPQNKARAVQAVNMKPKQLAKWAEPIKQATDKEKINAFIDDIMKGEMRHSGY